MSFAPCATRLRKSKDGWPRRWRSDLAACLPGLPPQPIWCGRGSSRSTGPSAGAFRLPVLWSFTGPPPATQEQSRVSRLLWSAFSRTASMRRCCGSAIPRGRPALCAGAGRGFRAAPGRPPRGGGRTSCRCPVDRRGGCPCRRPAGDPAGDPRQPARPRPDGDPAAAPPRAALRIPASSPARSR